MNKKILIFGAHPDDAEFGCGGLIIKEVKAGHQVKIVVCSLGEAGTSGTPAGRKKEAMDSAKAMGAEVEFINLGGDCHIENNPKNTIKLAEIIRTYKPNIVLAQSLSENQHPDHFAVSHMTRSATRLARYGGLKELKKQKIHAIDALYYYPSSAELDKNPDIIVDVSGEYEAWARAMHMHKSQMQTKGYINLVSNKARAFGTLIGTEYAIPLWVNDPIVLDSIATLDVSGRHYK
ncbi:MAG: PIG-L family deacetylase [Candidatus Pacebacteria bacterium]|nr:PIG-L family deacetylase [Candidatus Paceibacterota bacterium]